MIILFSCNISMINSCFTFFRKRFASYDYVFHWRICYRLFIQQPLLLLVIFYLILFLSCRFNRVLLFFTRIFMYSFESWFFLSLYACKATNTWAWFVFFLLIWSECDSLYAPVGKMGLLKSALSPFAYVDSPLKVVLHWNTICVR